MFLNVTTEGYTQQKTLLIFLFEKTTFEEYEKPIYFVTNRDFVSNKIIFPYMQVLAVQKSRKSQTNSEILDI